jgi:hypothetical protein
MSKPILQRGLEATMELMDAQIRIKTLIQMSKPITEVAYNNGCATIEDIANLSRPEMSREELNKAAKFWDNVPQQPYIMSRPSRLRRLIARYKHTSKFSQVNWNVYHKVFSKLQSYK